MRRTLYITYFDLLMAFSVVALVVAYAMGAPMWLGFSIGAIYGFHNQQDILERRVAEVDQNVVYDAIREAMAFYNQELTDSLSLFVRSVGGEHSVGYQPPAESARLQGMDEWGRPIPRRIPAPMARRIPLFMAQDSIAANWLTRRRITVQEVADRVEFLQEADTNWMRDQMMAAIFTNTGYTFADQQHGQFTVATFANNDTETYFRDTGSSGTDNHYLADASATATTVILTNMAAELKEHRDNSGEVLVFANTADIPGIRALPGFTVRADPNVSLGVAVNQYVGGPGVSHPGVLRGYDDDAMVHIIEWPRLPAGYLVAVMTGGGRPVAMREDELPALRGFQEIYERVDEPYLQRIWMRRAGFAAHNRVGIVVQRLGNASYAPPANLTAPL